MSAQTRMVVVLLAVCLLGFPPSASADTIDQSFMTPTTVNDTIGPGTLSAQVYTAGLSGTLAGINLDLFNTNSVNPVSVSIYSVLNGVPTFTALTSTSVIFTGPSQLITFPTAIAQVAGTQYAIVVTCFGGPYCASWNGATGFPSLLPPYAGGESYFFQVGISQAWLVTPLADWHFQTHVNVVPEPGTLALLGSGLAGIWLRRRRRI